MKRSYIAALNHETGNDAVENDIVVFAGCCKGGEVATCLSVIVSVL